MASPSIDAEALVARLWEDVRTREAAHASVDSLRSIGGERLQHLGDLRFVNQHWNFANPDPGRVGGRTVKGRVKAALARFLVHFLSDHFAEERDFNGAVVRVSNTMAWRHDDLADDLATLARALRDESQRLADRDAMFHALVEERLERIERMLDGGQGRQ